MQNVIQLGVALQGVIELNVAAHYATLKVVMKKNFNGANLFIALTTGDQVTHVLEKVPIGQRPTTIA